MRCPDCRERAGKHAPACPRRVDDPEDLLAVEYCCGCLRPTQRLHSGSVFCEPCEKLFYTCKECGNADALAAHMKREHAPPPSTPQSLRWKAAPARRRRMGDERAAGHHQRPGRAADHHGLGARAVAPGGGEARRGTGRRVERERRRKRGDAIAVTTPPPKPKRTRRCRPVTEDTDGTVTRRPPCRKRRPKQLPPFTPGWALRLEAAAATHRRAGARLRACGCDAGPAPLLKSCG